MRYAKFLKYIHRAGDLLLLNLSYLLAYLISFPSFNKFTSEHFLLLWFNMNVFWMLISYFSKTYEQTRNFRFETVFADLAKSVGFLFLLVALLIVIIKGYYFSRQHLVLTFGFFIIFISLWRFGFLRYLKHIRKKGYNFRRIIVVGTGKMALSFLDIVERNASFGYRVVKKLSIDNEDDIAVLKGYCDQNHVDEIFWAQEPADDRLTEIMNFCDDAMIRLKLIPDLGPFVNRQSEVDFYGSLPVLKARNEPLEKLFNRVVKRVFDIAVSTIVCLLVLPIFTLIIGLLIKLESDGPIFFIQKRSGYQNQEFSCWKFRTMVENHNHETKQAEESDQRVTKIGRFLRKTSLDELPQFINVLVGQMSVIGPRPHMLEHTDQYAQLVKGFMVRHFVKPGITGLAQVRGLRGQTSDPLRMAKRVKTDIWYLENWSFFLDLKIAVLTAFLMVRGQKEAY